MERFLGGAEPIGNSFTGEVACKPLASKVDQPEPEENQVGGGFECNICLDLVQDPVVTFCGHLYCWSCIYKWIISFPNDPDEQTPSCPVCKTEVSEKTMIPLYGRGQPTHPSKHDAHLIPERPSTPVPRTDRSSPFNHLPHRSFTVPEQQQPYLTAVSHTPPAPTADPRIGVFGEMVYARIFGNSGAALYTYPASYRYTASPRQQHRMTQMNRSLSRLCFFLCCCTVMCLLLF